MGLGLAWFLTAEDVGVVEVDRPDGKTRRDQVKSDPIDAYAAARRQRQAHPRPVLHARPARRARQHPPRGHRSRLRSTRGDPPTRRRSRNGTYARDASSTTAATERSLASIAGRVQQLDVEIADLDDYLEALLTPLASTLLDLQSVGLDVASHLLVTASNNPHRIATEAAFQEAHIRCLKRYIARESTAIQADLRADPPLALHSVFRGPLWSLIGCRLS